MRLVFKAPAPLTEPIIEIPRWPDRPDAFALSACPFGCDWDWPEFVSREQAGSQPQAKNAPRR